MWKMWMCSIIGGVNDLFAWLAKKQRSAELISLIINILYLRMLSCYPHFGRNIAVNYLLFFKLLAVRFRNLLFLFYFCVLRY